MNISIQSPKQADPRNCCGSPKKGMSIPFTLLPYGSSVRQLPSIKTGIRSEAKAA